MTSQKPETKSQVEPAKSLSPEGMTPKDSNSKFLVVSTAIGVGVIILGMAYYYFSTAVH